MVLQPAGHPRLAAAGPAPPGVLRGDFRQCPRVRRFAVRQESGAMRFPPAPGAAGGVTGGDAAGSGGRRPLVDPPGR